MENNFILEKLTEKFGDAILGHSVNFDIMTCEVAKDFNLKVLQFLYDEKDLGFQFLTDLTAIHYPHHQGKELVVTYLVYNMHKGKHFRINCALDIQDPTIFTATKIFEAANWLEREAFDFFGVKFIGHPNLIRVMNVDEMDYHPLRKEFPLEDQTRKDKDDEMFGRGGSFNLGKINI